MLGGHGMFYSILLIKLMALNYISLLIGFDVTK